MLLPLESSLCNLCTRACARVHGGVQDCAFHRSDDKDAVAASFRVEPLWYCVALLANPDELVIPSAVTPG